MRYLSNAIKTLSDEKFLFIAGPRQVGKTTIAKEWLALHSGKYLNWDLTSDRQAVRKLFTQAESPSQYLVLDEIHKYARWKNGLKGAYDHIGKQLKLVVTGSARLDVYQRGGDSLFGRYNLLRLHPFSIAEVCSLENNLFESSPPPHEPQQWLSLFRKANINSWNQLYQYSGFPEPYLKAQQNFYNRWSLRRKELVLKEDIRDISQIKSISLVEQLADLLPERVGSHLSINNLRENLDISFDTAKNWIETLERLYYCFRVPPFSKRIQRSLKTNNKFYLWDWAQIESKGAHFENMVASHLLKAVHYWTDLGYGQYSLHYWKNRDGQEVDFIITLKGNPVCAIECKSSDTTLSSNLQYFAKNYPNIPMIQLVSLPNVRIIGKNYLISSAWDWLAGLV